MASQSAKRKGFSVADNETEDQMRIDYHQERTGLQHQSFKFAETLAQPVGENNAKLVLNVAS